MDIVVKPISQETAWELVDLLGRSMGRVVEGPPGRFVIEPEGGAIVTMAGLANGPHASLDAALAEIERHTRGTCHRAPVGA